MFGDKILKTQDGLSEALSQVSSSLHYGLGMHFSRSGSCDFYLQRQRWTRRYTSICWMFTLFYPRRNLCGCQHNLAPAHHADETAKRLKEKRIDILEWLIHSLYLNIIEFVWQKTKIRIQQVHFRTLELKAVLYEQG